MLTATLTRTYVMRHKLIIAPVTAGSTACHSHEGRRWKQVQCCMLLQHQTMNNPNIASLSPHSSLKSMVSVFVMAYEKQHSCNSLMMNNHNRNYSLARTVKNKLFAPKMSIYNCTSHVAVTLDCHNSLSTEPPHMFT